MDVLAHKLLIDCFDCLVGVGTKRVDIGDSGIRTDIPGVIDPGITVETAS
ncbi:hypothetical protein [Halohasta litorea]|uniref:Uncharacterized protein n=1 Tax=Halohasta litorea TaxID=869891 RepID=A0ABD6DE39_9EURY|nr:hypothetical protein [Halohasta litorea]